MKKVIFFIVFICCCILHLSAIDKPIQIVTFDYPPFMSNDNGIISGINIEIINEVFSEMQQSITITFFPVSRCLKMMENNETDGMFSLKKTPERENSMIFPTESLLIQDYVIFKSIDSDFSFTGDLSSLVNVTIGVVDNTSYGPLFDNAVNNKVLLNIDSAPSFELTFKKLIAKRMEVVICSRIVGLTILKELGYQDNIVISGPIVEIVPSYIAFSKKENGKKLAESFDDVMKKIKINGTLEKILSKYVE
jgi:polar amino acid transport system substrate-binding protein